MGNILSPFQGASQGHIHSSQPKGELTTVPCRCSPPPSLAPRLQLWAQYLETHHSRHHIPQIVDLRRGGEGWWLDLLSTANIGDLLVEVFCPHNAVDGLRRCVADGAGGKAFGWRFGVTLITLTHSLPAKNTAQLNYSPLHPPILTNLSNHSDLSQVTSRSTLHQRHPGCQT